jgi:hypothetical protein
MELKTIADYHRYAAEETDAATGVLGYSAADDLDRLPAEKQAEIKMVAEWFMGLWTLEELAGVVGPEIARRASEQV